MCSFLPLLFPPFILFLVTHRAILFWRWLFRPVYSSQYHLVPYWHALCWILLSPLYSDCTLLLVGGFPSFSALVSPHLFFILILLGVGWPVFLLFCWLVVFLSVKCIFSFFSPLGSEFGGRGSFSRSSYHSSHFPLRFFTLLFSSLQVSFPFIGGIFCLFIVFPRCGVPRAIISSYHFTLGCSMLFPFYQHCNILFFDSCAFFWLIPVVVRIGILCSFFWLGSSRYVLPFLPLLI